MKLYLFLKHFKYAHTYVCNKSNVQEYELSAHMEACVHSYDTAI